MMKHRILLALLVTMCLIMASCRRSNDASENQNIEMTLTVEPESPNVGNSELVITLLDQEGAPISGASLDVRGDMSHAGMAPVLAELFTAEAGVYRVPFAWTMGGDWIVTVTATLPDGEVVEKTFDVTVSSN